MSRRYTDHEVVELHNQVRELSGALQVVLDELLERVMTAMEEGQADYAGAADVIAQVRSLGAIRGGGTAPAGPGTEP